MARPTGSCPPGRKPLLSDRETALGRRSFRPSPCRGRHPSSPRRRGGSNIHSYFWPMWLKYSFPLVAQILVPTWLKYSLTFTKCEENTRYSIKVKEAALYLVSKSNTELFRYTLSQKAIIEVFIIHRKDILILLAVVAIVILLGGISGKLLLDNLI